jgi:type I restriction enzyme R subunit
MVDEGVSQTIRNQKPDEIPHFFAYSQLLISISSTDARYGTTKTPKKFWAKWREKKFSEAHFQAIKNTPLPLPVRDALLFGKPKAVQRHFETLWKDVQFVTDQDRLLISLLSKDRLLEFIRFFVLFDKKRARSQRAISRLSGSKR